MYGQEDANGRLVCQNLPSHSNYLLSAKFKKDPLNLAQGYWSQVGAGYASYNFTWGFTGTFDSSESTEYEQTLDL